MTDVHIPPKAQSVINIEITNSGVGGGGGVMLVWLQIKRMPFASLKKKIMMDMIIVVIHLIHWCKKYQSNPDLVLGSSGRRPS